MGGNPLGKSKGKYLVDGVKTDNGPPIVQVVLFSPFMDQLNDPRVDGYRQAVIVSGLMSDFHKVRIEHFIKSLDEFIRQTIRAEVLALARPLIASLFHSQWKGASN